MEKFLEYLRGRTQSELARAIGVTQGAVSHWIVAGQIPVKRVPQIAKITGIPLAELRPDVFGEFRQ